MPLQGLPGGADADSNRRPACARGLNTSAGQLECAERNADKVGAGNGFFQLFFGSEPVDTDIWCNGLPSGLSDRQVWCTPRGAET